MSKIDQRKYLKKYLSGEKRKKKKDKYSGEDKSRVKIIDDDVDVFKNRLDDDDELFLTGEDAPQIVGIIDDRPPEIKTIEDFRSSKKWKSVSRSNCVSEGSTAAINTFSLNLNQNKKPNSLNEKNINQGQSNSSTISPLTSKYNSDDGPKYFKKDNISDDDLSPQRRRPGSYDFSPNRKQDRLTHHKRCSSEDLSPPRKQNMLRKKNVIDNSEEKKEKAYDSDYSPQRKKSTSSGRKLLGSNSLQEERQYMKTNQRENHISRKDQEEINNPFSKKRRKADSDEVAKIDSLNDKDDKGNHRIEKTLDGKKAGLQDARSLKKESQILQKKHDEIFEKLPADISGKNADIVVREKRPKTAAEVRREREEEKEKSEREREKQEAYSRWGVGLKQIETYQNKVAEEMYEISKPLARYSDDTDLDEHLKKQERDGDPMLSYIRQKNKESEKNSNKPIIPIYKGTFPENRYNIRPGYRWDGVDRSNGYEKKWFDVQNQKKALQEEAYKYSIEDM